MTNLNELQSELAALTERVNSAMELTKDSITLTNDELKRLINLVRGQACEHMNEEIESAVDGTDFDDYIDLELSGREIELNFDDRQLKRDLRGSIENKSDVNDDELYTLLKEIKEA